MDKTNFKIRINGNWFIVGQTVSTNHMKRLAKIPNGTLYKEHSEGKLTKIKNESINVLEHHPRYYLVKEKFGFFKNLFR